MTLNNGFYFLNSLFSLNVCIKSYCGVDNDFSMRNPQTKVIGEYWP